MTEQLQRAPIAMDAHGVRLSTFEDAYRFASAISKSGLAPRGLDSPEKVLVALQTGIEAGLSPMASVRSIVVINGMPTWKGDAALALVQGSGRLTHYEEKFEGLPPDGTDLKDWPLNARHVLVMARDGGPRRSFAFSVSDARTARLWMRKGRQGEDTPWTTYPQRMLRYRNLGFALRDMFSDVLCNLRTAEEVRDMPEVRSAYQAPVDREPTGDDPLLAEIVTPVSQSDPPAEQDERLSAIGQQSLL